MAFSISCSNAMFASIFNPVMSIAAFIEEDCSGSVTAIFKVFFNRKSGKILCVLAILSGIKSTILSSI